MCETYGLLSIDRKRYTNAMAKNLPMLRAKINVNQEEFANVIGVTRQTISAIENKTRELTWSNYLSMLFLFTQNAETKELLQVLGIYTPELERYFTFARLDNLQ